MTCDSEIHFRAKPFLKYPLDFRGPPSVLFMCFLTMITNNWPRDPCNPSRSPMLRTSGPHIPFLSADNSHVTRSKTPSLCMLAAICQFPQINLAFSISRSGCWMNGSNGYLLQIELTWNDHEMLNITMMGVGRFTNLPIPRLTIWFILR